MIVGFTGTRAGMTAQQQAVVYKLLRDMDPEPAWLLHGDCVGADAQAFEIADRQGISTQAFPCTGDERWHANTKSTIRSSPCAALKRNRYIVDLCELLIAAPKEMEEITRSGTWATVRYASALRRRHVIVWPDGEVTEGWKP